MLTYDNLRYFFFASVFGLALGCSAPATNERISSLSADDKNSDDNDEGDGVDDRDYDDDRGRCRPTDVRRNDLYVEMTSPLPGSYGQPAYIHLHEVAPVYPHDCRHHRKKRIVLMVPGYMTDAITDFDLQFEDYSVQAALASVGVTSYVMDPLGDGGSSRFSLDDPCNASPDDQRNWLIPNPLSAVCPQTDPWQFVTRAAELAQIDAMVDYLRAAKRVRKVHLYGWSRGGTLVGHYSLYHPEKVRDVFIHASGIHTGPLWDFEAFHKGYPLAFRAHRTFLNIFLHEPGVTYCPGQADPAVGDAIVAGLRAADPLGATWGPRDPQDPTHDGLFREGTAFAAGWNVEQAADLSVPVAFIVGTGDTRLEAHEDLYAIDPVAQKVLIKVECSSHRIPWETTNNPNWPGGPHVALQKAAKEWLTRGTYQGFHNGIFTVHSDGTIEGP